jgi:hypothetical protein
LGIDTGFVNVITIGCVRGQTPINALKTGPTMHRVSKILERATSGFL